MPTTSWGNCQMVNHATALNYHISALHCIWLGCVALSWLHFSTPDTGQWTDCNGGMQLGGILAWENSGGFFLAAVAKSRKCQICCQISQISNPWTGNLISRYTLCAPYRVHGQMLYFSYFAPGLPGCYPPPPAPAQNLELKLWGSKVQCQQILWSGCGGKFNSDWEWALQYLQTTDLGTPLPLSQFLYC